MPHQARRPMLTKPIAAALIAFAGAAAAGPVSYQWALPVDGFWSNPLNWNPNGVPGLMDNVELGLTGPYTISLGPATQDAANFHITNPQAALHIINSRSLRIRQGIVNHGQIVLSPNNEPRAPVVVLADGSTIAGSGILRLGAPGSLAQLAGFVIGDSATQHAGHTIAGMGSVSINLNNHGAVIADAPGNALTLSGQALQNHAAFSAVGGGILDIRAPMSQSDQGSTLAAGPGSRIEIHAPQVTGGSLGAGYDASVRLLTTSKTINSVHLHGDFTVQPGITVTLTGTHLDGVNMAIDPTPSAATVFVLGPQTQWSSGSLALTQPLDRLETAPDAQGVVLGPNLLLSGIGVLRLNAVNHATLRANQPGQSLQMQISSLEHHGTIEVVNGATLSVSNSTISRMPGSVLRADGPGSLLRITATNTGGEIPITDGARLELGRTNNDSVMTLDSPVLSGDVTLLPATSLTVVGPFVNNATVRVMPPLSNNRFTRLLLADGARIDGTGTIELSEFGSEIAPQTPGGVVTLGPDQTITGTGEVRTGLIIEGAVRAEVGDYLRLYGGPITARAEVRASAGTLVIAAPFTQEPGSRLIVENGGSLLLVRNQLTANIIGGVVDVEEGSSFRTHDGRLTGVTVNGATSVWFSGTLQLEGGFTNNGRLLVNENTSIGSSTVEFVGPMTIDGLGVITLSDNLNRSRMWAPPGVVVELGPHQRLEGAGILDVELVVHGTVAPGIGVGTLFSYRDLTLAPTATLEIEIAPTANDQVIIRGVDIGGTLDLRFIDGFSPATPYWDRVFMFAGFGHSGAFNQITGPALADPRLEYRVRFANGEFRVGTYCKADVNSDRQLNFFDVSAFINLFNAGDPAADIAAPFGVVNFFDLSAYINRFNAGCP